MSYEFMINNAGFITPTICVSIIYIYVNYNISLTWIKAHVGTIPLTNYDFQRYIYVYSHGSYKPKKHFTPTGHEATKRSGDQDVSPSDRQNKNPISNQSRFQCETCVVSDIPSGNDQHSHGLKAIHKWRFLAGKFIYFYGPFSMAMLNNQRVLFQDLFKSNFVWNGLRHMKQLVNALLQVSILLTQFHNKPWSIFSWDARVRSTWAARLAAARLATARTKYWKEKHMPKKMVICSTTSCLSQIHSKRSFSYTLIIPTSRYISCCLTHQPDPTNDLGGVVAGGFNLPRWKIWVCHLGWWNSQYIGKRIQMFQTTNQKSMFYTSN